MDVDVIQSFVVRIIEMATHLFCVFGYVIKVGLETVHEAPFGLTYILYFAGVASDAIYEVVGFTGRMGYTVVCFASDGTGKLQSWRAWR